MEYFNEQKHMNMVDVTMCNVHDERDVWMMLMDLSDIKRKLLNKLERDVMKQVGTVHDLRDITGMMKQRYIGLKVVQLLKKTHKEFDTAWGR